MALSPDNIIAVSNLLAQNAVDALISTEPILPTCYKGDAQTFENREFQSGETINIRVADQPMMPIQSNVIQLDPVINQVIPATVLQYNDGMRLSGIAQQYAIGGMSRVEEEIGRPRGKNMAVKAAQIAYEALGSSMNFFGTPGSSPKTATDWGVAKALMNNQLAMDGLYVAMSPDTMAEVAGSLAEKFNPTKESATAYMDGVVKEAVGLNFYESSNIPNHTNGSAVGTGAAGMIVSANVTSGANSFTVSGGTTTGKITKNSLIWFSGDHAVQPNTKKTLPTLRYFTVAEEVDLSGGAGTIKVTEPIYGPEDVKLQNIETLPTTSNYVGIVGTAGVTYEQAFVYRKKAISFLGLKLPDLFSLDASNANYEGVPIKVTAFADGTNYLNMMRWDMLVTSVVRQWRHCGRCFTRALS
jgi:hypothetical protein